MTDNKRTLPEIRTDIEETEATIRANMNQQLDHPRDDLLRVIERSLRGRLSRLKLELTDAMIKRRHI